MIGGRWRNGHSVASRTWCVDRHGESQCLGGIEVEARENPSRLAARNILRPHQQAGYTSAIVSMSQKLSKSLQTGGVHIHPYMVLIAEDRDCDVDRRLRPIGPLLRLAELHRPARVAILLPQLGRMILPSFGNAAFLDCFLLVLGVALSRRGAATSVASTICPDMAMKPDARSAVSKCANNGSIAPTLVSFSPNSQIVRASGTRSAARAPESA